MATTNTYSGSLTITAEGKVSFGTDNSGQRLATRNLSITFDPTTAPTITGFFSGVAAVTTTPTDLLFAHATDPLQGLGDASYSDGFTVASSKLKLVIFEHLGTTGTVTIKRKATSGGLPIFDTESDSLTLDAGGIFLLYLKAGTAALTTTTNDAVTISASAGTINVQVTAFYGS